MMKRDIKFDKKAAGYDNREGKLSKKFYDLLIDNIELQDGAQILDIGCGTGSLLKRMADNCAISGHGIDVENNMINEAKKKCPEMNIQNARCDETPFNNQDFDLLTSCMAYHHFDNKKGFAKESARILKTGGILYIADVRFPLIVRKIINTVLKLHKIVGRFCTPQEVYDNFAEYGFIPAGYIRKGYAQLIKLRKV